MKTCVGLCGHCCRLFVMVIDGRKSIMMSQRIIKVHRTAANHRERLLHAMRCKKVRNVV